MKNIVVIGGGPGGYPAALKAAALGARVTLVEKNKLRMYSFKIAFGCGAPIPNGAEFARFVYGRRTSGGRSVVCRPLVG